MRSQYLPIGSAIVCALWLSTACVDVGGAPFRQIPYSQGSYVVGKLTRSYTRTELSSDLFATLGTVASFSYPDPDTQDKVSVVVALDPGTNRIVYTTSYQGETKISDFGGYGSALNQFNAPTDLAIGQVNVYVADAGNHRVSVLTWIADSGTPGLKRTMAAMFTIPGGSDFRYPDQLAWDDNGTPSNSVDDVIWVLDRGWGVVVGYHIVYTGVGPNYWTYSHYVTLDLDQLFPATNRRFPISLTKARAYSSPSEAATYCTTDLIVYDAANNCFMRVSVPRITGEITSPSSQVTCSTSPNPFPALVYTRLAADAWGNVHALDRVEGSLTKFSPTLAYVGSYGSRGTGGLGTQQMLSPNSLVFHMDNTPGANYKLGRQAVLGERWSDDTGVQALESALEMGPAIATFAPNATAPTIGVSVSDASRLRVRILNTANAVIRTLLDQVTAAGATEVTWDGRDGGGVAVPQCATYIAEVRAIGLYTPAETLTTTSTFYYKPRIVKILSISTGTLNASVSLDGTPTVIGQGAVTLPCSLCTSHTISVAPTQVIAGARYCFDRWSNDRPRAHAVSIAADSMIGLYLVLGPGPTTASGTVWDEAYDCKSPYRFTGNATLANRAGWDTFRTYGHVEFQVPKVQGSTRYGLTVSSPFKGTDVAFLTTDGSTATGTNMWNGVSVATPSFECDGCNFLNSSTGLSAGVLTSNLRVTHSLFEYNHDRGLSAVLDGTLHPTVRLVGNSFYESTFNSLFLTVTGNQNIQWGTAVVDSNSFLGPANSYGVLSMTGGWGGSVFANSFYINASNSRGIILSRYSELGNKYAWPFPSIHRNRFVTATGQGRVSLYAPEVSSFGFIPSTIDATHNLWGVGDNYNAIESTILDQDDNTDTTKVLAYVSFSPWDLEGGGGGGSGCPYVFAKVDTGYVVENSILGLSERLPAGTYVSDALPLVNARPDLDGRVRLRIAEPEQDVDQLDRVLLLTTDLARGEEVGVDAAGSPVAFVRSAEGLQAVSWTGKRAPFVSPLSPASYGGLDGDSLELSVPPGAKGRAVYVAMKPKPQQSEGIPNSGAITLRVFDGRDWATLPEVSPREYWSTTLLSIGLKDEAVLQGIRIIWHGRHTLGAVGLANVRPLSTEAAVAPSRSIRSDGADLNIPLSAIDGRVVRILPGEHLDLEFASGNLSPNSRLVLLVHGGYGRVAGAGTSTPDHFTVAQNSPNPFNPETSIEFALPARSRVQLRIFDVAGRLVRTLADRVWDSGTYHLRWDGKGDSGAALASGVYFYEFRAAGFTERKRMVLLR
jgi:flagellar hook assembly protein FlgD